MTRVAILSMSQSPGEVGHDGECGCTHRESESRRKSERKQGMMARVAILTMSQNPGGRVKGSRA